MSKLSPLQWQLALLNELQKALVFEHRKLRHMYSLLQKPPLQLNITIGDQLPHYWLPLDLQRGRKSLTCECNISKNV